KSSWREGDTVPLRIALSLAAGSSHTVVLKYDFTVSSKPTVRFFDYLRSYDASYDGVSYPIADKPDILNGTGISGPPTVTYPVPTDTSITGFTQASGSIAVYNATIDTTLGSPTGTYGWDTTAHEVRTVTIKLDVISGTRNK